MLKQSLLLLLYALFFYYIFCLIVITYKEKSLKVYLREISCTSS